MFSGSSFCEVVLSIGRLVDLVDIADVRVIEGRRGLRLLQEPLLGDGVPRQIRGEDLDRHLTVETRIPGEVDDTYPALADLGAGVIRAERGAGCEGHR